MHLEGENLEIKQDKVGHKVKKISIPQELPLLRVKMNFSIILFHMSWMHIMAGGIYRCVRRDEGKGG